MIDGLKPYPEYKDSGVEWLGLVPAHWEVVPLKRLAWFKSGAGFPVHYQGDTSEKIPFFKVSDMNIPGNEKYLHVCANTVSMTVAQDLGATVLPAGTIVFPKVGGALLTNKRRIAANQCCIDNNMMGCVARNGNRDFLFLIMSYIDLGHIAKPGPVPAISEGEVREIRVALPSAPEQTAIVRFLDYVDRRIRRVIRARQRRIKLLEEYKQALIHQAVTGQIDVRTGQPYPAYRDSGVEWLGEVPVHWDIVPNRAVLRLKKHLVGKASTDYTLLSLTKGGIVVRDLENPEGKFPTSFDTYQVVEPGDIIFCLFDIDETPRAIGLSSLHGMITGAYTVFECTDPVVRAYVYLFYLSMDIGKFLKPLYTGLRKVITKSAFLTAKMPLPTKEEQSAIVEYLDTQTVKIDAAISAARREIDLLREYRTRLIADVVTGKLDVREVAARLPEEPPEEEAELMDTEEIAEAEATDEEAVAEALSEEVEP